uniref:Uncharacterized protein n=1 Tax=Peronospora matthiolae TaxID=2874970 RepID=A0AAV1UC05_9STRA
MLLVLMFVPLVLLLLFLVLPAFLLLVLFELTVLALLELLLIDMMLSSVLRKKEDVAGVLVAEVSGAVIVETVHVTMLLQLQYQWLEEPEEKMLNMLYWSLLVLS